MLAKLRYSTLVEDRETVCCFFELQEIKFPLRKMIRSQLVSQLIHVQLVSLDFGPQGVINKIYNLLHHELG